MCHTWVRGVDAAIYDADDDAAAALRELVRLWHVHLLHVPARHSPSALHGCRTFGTSCLSPQGGPQGGQRAEALHSAEHAVRQA